MDWKDWPIGSKVIYYWNEFDGSGSMKGILTAKEDDHSIVEAEDLKLWLDDDTADMFRIVKKKL